MKKGTKARKPKRAGMGWIKEQLDTFCGVRFWLQAEESKVLDKVEWLTLRKAPIPESLLDRLEELQQRYRSLAKERRRFLRRHKLAISQCN